MSVGLAQEVGEAPEQGRTQDVTAVLEDLLADCAFALTPEARAGCRGISLAGDAGRWRRLLGTCHAHLRGGTEPAAQPSAALAAARNGDLELIMEHNDLNARWQMSVLRSS